MKKISTSIGLFFLFCMLAFPAALYAEFVWVDHNGNTRHTKFAPQPHQVRKYIANGQKQQKKRAKVELFVTSWCPYCHKAKAFFEKRNIAVKVYDIEKNKKAAARKRKLDPQRGVPFAVVNGKGIHGYAPEQYLRALKNK
ncbi:MAG: glutaredoxin domain-containing protein [Thermodesulfobacteriota bacterium]